MGEWILHPASKDRHDDVLRKLRELQLEPTPENVAILESSMPGVVAAGLSLPVGLYRIEARTSPATKILIGRS